MADKQYKFTKFERHVDNAEQIISADHPNVIQQAVNQTEKSIVDLYDIGFEQKALFKFDNSVYANSIFIDKLNDMEFIDIPRNKNVQLNSKETCIEIISGFESGDFTTRFQYGEFGTVLDDFSVIAEVSIPKGAEIEFFLTCDNSNYFPIKANTNKPPLHLGQSRGTQFKLKVVMRANAQGQSPKIYGYAVLFFDEMLDNTYGMTNPDLRRFEQKESSSVTLIRDRALEDKLVRVVESSQITELHYDLEDGKLLYVTSNDGVYYTKTNMNYGSYYNSKGQVEEVLLGISEVPMSLEEAVPDEYKFIEEEGGGE